MTEVGVAAEGGERFGRVAAQDVGDVLAQRVEIVVERVADPGAQVLPEALDGVELGQ